MTTLEERRAAALAKIPERTAFRWAHSTSPEIAGALRSKRERQRDEFANREAARQLTGRIGGSDRHQVTRGQTIADRQVSRSRSQVGTTAHLTCLICASRGLGSVPVTYDVASRLYVHAHGYRTCGYRAEVRHAVEDSRVRAVPNGKPGARPVLVGSVEVIRQPTRHAPAPREDRPRRSRGPGIGQDCPTGPA